uniref:Uncharacterized protein n=1 Tax=Panagrolaimus superbus TaxID=310955 RepID=A0A914YQG8_9BILA
MDVYVADITCSLLGLDFCDDFAVSFRIAQISTPTAAAKSNVSVKTTSQPANVSDNVSSAIFQSYIDEIQKEFASLFQPGLGRCTKAHIHLQLKPNARRVHVKARRMNQPAMEVAKAEIDRLCSMNVMEEQKGGFAEYATPGSIVKRKDGRSRFVVDYSTGRFI